MPKAPKKTTTSATKNPGKSRSLSTKPAAKTRSPSHQAHSEKVASSAETRRDGKTKATAASRKREEDKKKQRKADEKIRERTSALILKEIENEEATVRSANGLPKKQSTLPDDDEMLQFGDTENEEISDEDAGDDDLQKAEPTEAGSGDDMNEERSEDDADLGIDDIQMSDPENDVGVDDGLGDDGVDDGDLVVQDNVVPISRGKRRSSGGSTFSKVTRADFSPRSLRLAEGGRTGVRVALATGDEGAFPEEHKAFTKHVLERLAEQPSADKEWMEILEEALDDMTKLLMLQGYAWAGASQMRGELKRRALMILSAHFGIPADSKAETMSLVNWLLEKGHFKYGGLDTKARTYDAQRPMGHPIFVDLISQQWFSSGKAEGIAKDTASMFKDIPLPIIVLVMTVVENALMEYKQDGTRTAIKFTSETMKPRYTHHMKCAKSLQENSPNWLTEYQKTMYKRILEQSRFTHLLAETDNGEIEEELEEIDFASLEQTVLQGV